MAGELEIYLSDLKPEAQRRVLKFLGFQESRKANLDIFPLFVLAKPEKG